MFLGRQELRFGQQVTVGSVRMTTGGDPHCAVFHLLDGNKGRITGIDGPGCYSIVDGWFDVSFPRLEQELFLASPLSAGEGAEDKRKRRKLGALVGCSPNP